MRERRFLALADDEEIVAALALEDGFGRALDRVRRAEPCAAGDGGDAVGAVSSAAREQVVLADVGGRVAFEDDRAGDAGSWRSSASAWTLSSHASRSSSGSQTTWKGLLPSTAPAASL